MQTLIERCLVADDGDAWCELWLLYLETAADLVQRLLLRCGFSAEDAEDAVMRLARELFLDPQCKLRSFRGSKRRQLGGWFAQVGANFARDWLRREIPLRQQMQTALLDYAGPSRQGLTRRQLEFIFEELELLAADSEADISAADVAHMRILAGLTESEQEIPDRTVRHWRKTLAEKLQNYFRDE